MHSYVRFLSSVLYKTHENAGFEDNVWTSGDVGGDIWGNTRLDFHMRNIPGWLFRGSRCNQVTKKVPRRSNPTLTPAGMHSSDTVAYRGTREATQLF